MQQRRPRLGDILDDYCPRERRLTNHAVVAMIEDEVKQTRCTTCDADHEYKHGKMPPPRRKKSSGVLAADGGEPSRPRVLATAPQPPSADTDDQPDLDHHDLDEPEPFEPAELSTNDAAAASADPDADADREDDAGEGREDEWPVHRPLIRATLPRPEGQVPERKAPDFTLRQSGGRGGFDNNNRNGQRQRGGHRPMRPGQGQGQGQSGQPTRFGGPRHGGGQAQGQRSGQPQRHGSGQGQQGNRPGQQQPRGQRAGGGQGRKRGR